jgi:DNA adenine methylase
MQNNLFYDSELVKSPLNYIGGKSKLLPQILPLFPNQIDTFVDLFAGGCNVGINVNAKKIHFNDNLIYLIDMYSAFLKIGVHDTLNHVEKQIKNFNLSNQNEDGYKEIRKKYNEKKNPLDLFVLIAFSFNHQIRFNNKHEFNNPFGRNRSSFNDKMKENLILFINRLKSINPVFTSLNFGKFDINFFKKNDFIYCDPPYLITTGSYNDGKRGFDGWGGNEEIQLLDFLYNLDKKKLRFALSNVIEHKGKKNDILIKWLSNNPSFNVHHLDFNYKNSNYQTTPTGKTIEVLVTNY